MEVTLVMVVAIFAINVYLGTPCPGFLPLFAGARRWADAAIVAGNYQHQLLMAPNGWPGKR